MNAAEWEKIQKNYKEIISDLIPSNIINILFERRVITVEDKATLENEVAYPTDEKKNSGLLNILRGKPQKSKPYCSFISCLKEENEWLANKIEETEAEADPRVHHKVHREEIADAVRKSLLKNYLEKDGTHTDLRAVRENLTTDKVFTPQSEWSNIELSEFLKHVFTGVRVKTKEERLGKKTKKFSVVENLARKPQQDAAPLHGASATAASKGPGIKFKLTRLQKEENRSAKEIPAIFSRGG